MKVVQRRKSKKAKRRRLYPLHNLYAHPVKRGKFSSGDEEGEDGNSSIEAPMLKGGGFRTGEGEQTKDR